MDSSLSISATSVSSVIIMLISQLLFLQNSRACLFIQMAMQAASTAAALPSAQIVGHAFVEQYYHILHQSPDLVHKFYQDSSVLSRPDSDGIMSSVTSMQAINDKIQSLDYKNYKAEIKTADAQESYQGGFIVLVTGCLTGCDNVRRRFTQTFFLAPQEKGYFVLNDVFRYIEESEQLEMKSASAGGINDSAPSAPLISDPEPTPAPDNPAPTFESEDLQNGAEVYNPSDNEEGSGLEEEVINEPPSQSGQNETVAVVSSDPSAAQEEKKSYASIVKVTKFAAASCSVYNPTSNMRWAPTNANQPVPLPVSAKPSSEPEALAPTSDSAPESSNAPEEVEGHSIYVRNLPLNAAVPQLEEVFRKFGPIKRGGVQVRSNKHQGFCFGFVEFESLDSMQSAIKESPVTIGGRQAVVEEKRTTTRGKLDLFSIDSLVSVEEERLGTLQEEGAVGIGTTTSGGVVGTLVAVAEEEGVVVTEGIMSSWAGPRGAHLADVMEREEEDIDELLIRMEVVVAVDLVVKVVE
ncbi:hypothetical protein LguiB_022932 [Lonicera macranthoides]